MRDWIRQKLPTEEALSKRPVLRWMGPLLGKPWLWHLNRRRVALGVGIGVFFGFLLPVAQIAGAALFAFLLRANLPVAAAATLISNPLTYAPIFLFAYRTGSALLGEAALPADEDALAATDDPPGAGGPGWIERAQAVGKPLMLGLAVFAVVGGVSAWALVHLAWAIAVRLKRRRRIRRAGGSA